MIQIATITSEPMSNQNNQPRTKGNKKRGRSKKQNGSLNINDTDHNKDNLNYQKCQNGKDNLIDKTNDNAIVQKSTRKTKQQRQSNLITNYFPIVSRRVLAAKLKEEEYNQKIIYHIENKTDPKDYLSVTEFEGKGKAIIASACIRKGAFICEYSGDLINLQTAKKRELNYELTKAGCYMYYFNWNSTIWCVDATQPTGRYGRLINHSRKAPNCKTKVFEHNSQPHLIFVALRDIEPNEEILYDYGERDPNAIKSNPWLTTS